MKQTKFAITLTSAMACLMVVIMAVQAGAPTYTPKLGQTERGLVLRAIRDAVEAEYAVTGKYPSLEPAAMKAWMAERDIDDHGHPWQTQPAWDKAGKKGYIVIEYTIDDEGRGWRRLHFGGAVENRSKIEGPEPNFLHTWYKTSSDPRTPQPARDTETPTANPPVGD